MKTPRIPEGLIPVGLVLLSLVPAVAGVARLGQLAGGAEVTEANARFFTSPLPVVLHILSVLPFSLLGAFQFAPSFRHRHRGWHRLAGRLLVVFGAVAAATGIWMTVSYPEAEGDGAVVWALRLTFGTAMALSILMGTLAIARRDYPGHGAWMTRAYAIGMGAGTQVVTHLPWLLLVGAPGETGRALAMGAGWVINVAVAEWVIRRPVRGGTPALAGAR